MDEQKPQAECFKIVQKLYEMKILTKIFFLLTLLKKPLSEKSDPLCITSR